MTSRKILIHDIDPDKVSTLNSMGLCFDILGLYRIYFNIQLLLFTTLIFINNILALVMCLLLLTVYIDRTFDCIFLLATGYY